MTCPLLPPTTGVSLSSNLAMFAECRLAPSASFTQPLPSPRRTTVACSGTEDMLLIALSSAASSLRAITSQPINSGASISEATPK